MSASGLPQGGLLSTLLAPPALLYRAAVRARNALYDSGRLRVHRLPCAVVSIGNLTAGGTGKTPLTSFVAGLLRDSGYRVGVASRGYRRHGTRAPLLVADGRALLVDAAHAGDEPYLIARDNPGVAVAVGADRAAAARLLLAAHNPEVIVLDDGFQHRRLGRDLDLLLLDGPDPWGNGKMLPLGPLREPLSGLARAGAIVLTRSEGKRPPALDSILARYNPDAVVFHCGLEPGTLVRPDGEAVASRSLQGFAVYAFSGIARPDRFEADLTRLGMRLVGARRFPDHHRFRRGDLAAVSRAARERRADVLLTTEKDLVRLADRPEGGPPLYALSIRVTFPPGPGLPAFILDRLAARRGSGRPRVTS